MIFKYNMMLSNDKCSEKIWGRGDWSNCSAFEDGVNTALRKR